MIENSERDKEGDRRKIRTALGQASVLYPFLAGILAVLNFQVDARCETACVFPSGRTLINPFFLDCLNTSDLAFILAHEAMHIFLGSHERCTPDDDGYLTNLAHDFIINDILCEESNGDFERPPADGLYWPDYAGEYNIKFRDDDKEWKPARSFSYEELALELAKMRRDLFTRGWNFNKKKEAAKKEPEKPQGLGDLIAQKLGMNKPEPLEPQEPQKEGLADLLLPKSKDVLSTEWELKLFPDELIDVLKSKTDELKKITVESITGKLILDRISAFHPGTEAGNESMNTQMLRGCYSVPWESAMQHWFDAVEPGRRSWARPSRRGADRVDTVLPGRSREGWIIHAVLDTSGSMVDILPKALGLIVQFCENVNITTVHILQIDTIIQADEYVDIADLENYKILGLGDNDLDPAWERLSEDPEIQHVVVITDGWLEVPDPPPFDVLWAITENNTSFNPSYGTVVYMNLEQD
ncbi:MAG: VWA-like domain-containing protein [Planctomycetia bacterium]|nr:VWA-like domain-containing protein [Planctomycetia bacterium]